MKVFRDHSFQFAFIRLTSHKRICSLLKQISSTMDPAVSRDFGQPPQTAEAHVTFLKEHSYKKATLPGHHEANGRWTGKMSVLLATIRFSCFVVAITAMRVGITHAGRDGGCRSCRRNE